MAIGSVSENNSPLLLRSSCTYPGYIITYECTVTGEHFGATVWGGSAFSYQGLNDETILLHCLFPESALGNCNSSSIAGYSVRIDNGLYFISQLNVTVSSDMIGKSIMCFYDNNSELDLVGTLNITLT